MSSFRQPRDAALESDSPLAPAFPSFSDTGGSLERTYGQLPAEIAHLRQELEGTNRDLANSLEKNRRIRDRLRRIMEGLPFGVLMMEVGAPILMPATSARSHLRCLLEPFLPKVVVLSPLEIPSMVPVQSLGTVR